jgi:transcriptional regulator with XRE-family HTH domain
MLQLLGDRIKFIREDKKMGLNETAGLAGISGSYLSNIENGIKKNPSMKTLSKIAAALGVSVDDFFRGEKTHVTEEDYKPALSVREQEKLDAQAEEMLADLRISLSQNKGQLSENDYDIIGATVRTLLEQMTKNNKEKYTPKIYKNNK